MKTANLFRTFVVSLVAAGTLFTSNCCSAQQAKLPAITGHGTGFAGKVYLVPTLGDKTGYQTTLSLYTRFNGRIVKVGEGETNPDGTFFLHVPARQYALVATDLPDGYSSDPVVFTVQPNRVTLVEVDVSGP